MILLVVLESYYVFIGKETYDKNTLAIIAVMINCTVVICACLPDK